MTAQSLCNIPLVMLSIGMADHLFVVISDFSSHCYEEIPDHRSYSQQILNSTLISVPEAVWSELLNLSWKSK